MKDNILSDEKLYYSISEVAEYFEVSTSLIRYWETEFSFLRPHKNSKGDRRFTRANIDQIQTIYDKKKSQENIKVLKKLKSLKQGLEELRDKI